MLVIYELLDLVLRVAQVAMIVHIVVSWLVNFDVLNPRQQLVGSLWTGLGKLLEPVYQPIRRYMPDTRPLDLAPLAAFVAVIALRRIILPAIFL